MIKTYATFGNKSEWIELPTTLKEIRNTLELPFIESLDNIDVYDTQSDIISRRDLSTYDIDQLNELATKIEEFNPKELKILEVMLNELGESLDYAVDIIDNRDYELIYNIKNFRELGEYLVNIGAENIPAMIIDFIDTESLGYFYATKTAGNFTNIGYLRVF